MLSNGFLSAPEQGCYRSLLRLWRGGPADWQLAVNARGEWSLGRAGNPTPVSLLRDKSFWRAGFAVVTLQLPDGRQRVVWACGQSGNWRRLSAWFHSGPV